jgi:hypothetical protein
MRMNRKPEIPSKIEEFFSVTLAAEKLDVFTEPGIPNWEMGVPAEQ